MSSCFDCNYRVKCKPVDISLYIGLIIWLIGFSVEFVADLQKAGLETNQIIKINLLIRVYGPYHVTQTILEKLSCGLNFNYRSSRFERLAIFFSYFTNICLRLAHESEWNTYS